MPEIIRAPETTYSASELWRIAHHRAEQYSHAPPEGAPRFGGSLSTGDLLYYLAKHIEQCPSCGVAGKQVSASVAQYWRLRAKALEAQIEAARAEKPR